VRRAAIQWIRSAAVLAAVACGPAVAEAQYPSAGPQHVEVTPIGGYRFGGDFFERITGQPVDLDGAPAVGGVVNIPLYDGLFIEALFSHQQAHVTVPASPFGPSTRWTIDVDHWQGGGLQEFGTDPRLRPFLTGLLGLTRYAGADDNEIRFTVAAGGGVKLMPTPRFGLRLDGRVYATFVEAEGRAIACSPGICLFSLDADIVWQAEFTAGIVFGF
jgi:hypothetical protein